MGLLGAPAALLVELTGQGEQAPVALVAAGIDRPGLDRGLDRALRLAQVQAVLELAVAGPGRDFGKSGLDLGQGTTGGA